MGLCFMSDQDAKPITRFQRANFLVSNLERSLTLYRDVLDFDLVFIKDSESDSYSYEVFQIDKSAELRFAVLSLEGQRNVMALTEVKGITLPGKTFPSTATIVLECQQFDKVVRGVKDLGLEVFTEEKLLTKDGRTGREIGFLDFDDNLVVIYKILTKPEKELP